MHQPRPGCRKPCIADRNHRRHDETAAGAVSGDRDAPGRVASGQQEAIPGNGILDRGGKRMLGRKPIIEREGRGSCRSARLGDQVAVAV